MRCTYCNWHVHDASIHGKLCSKGHPLALYGTTRNGACRKCRAIRAMKYYYRSKKTENARSRQYHKTHRAQIIARKRAQRSRVSTPGSDHPWRY